MLYVTKFKVQGKGQFPLDMLRYDGCYPDTSEDAVRMAEALERYVRDFITISLRRVHNGKEPRITHGRWESFGWTVIGHETHKL